MPERISSSSKMRCSVDVHIPVEHEEIDQTSCVYSNNLKGPSLCRVCLTAQDTAATLCQALRLSQLVAACSKQWVVCFSDTHRQAEPLIDMT